MPDVMTPAEAANVLRVSEESSPHAPSRTGTLRLAHPTIMDGALASLALSFSGDAWRGMRLEARPKVWFGVSLAIAAVWSLFSGALLIDLILKL